MPAQTTRVSERGESIARSFASPMSVGRRGRGGVGVALFLALLAAPVLAEPNPRVQELAQHPERFPQVLREFRERYRQDVSHYSARLLRRQNKSETPTGLGKWEKIRFSLREQGGPWGVYMYWEKGPIDGLEALYVQGQYEDKIWVKHPMLRLFPPLSFDVDDPAVTKDNRHPITMAGIGRLMDSLLQQCDLAEQYGDAAGAFQYLGPGEVSGRPTVKIVREVPHRPDYYCHKAVIELDAEWGYPVKITTVNWDGIILEQIIYEDVKWDEASCTDDQFDKDKVFSILKVLGP
jgi:hypothetical protein